MTLFQTLGALLGVIGGLIGILGGGLSIYDRLRGPDLELLGITPVLVADYVEQEHSIYGISLIARVRNNGNKTSAVLGANIYGKIFIPYDEFAQILNLPIEKDTGDPEAKKIFNDLKPYRIIAWAGWLDDKQSLLRVDPGEERYIKITFREPTEEFYVMDMQFTADDIGYEKTNELPKTFSHYPHTSHFEENRALRSEYFDDFIQFKIALGRKTKIVSQDKIKPLIEVWDCDWNKHTARKLYLDSESP